MGQGLNSQARQIQLFCHNSISELEPDWRKLEENSSCSPFQRLSWLKPLYEQISDEYSQPDEATREPLLISGYLGKRLVLVIPMMLESNIFGKRLKWVCSEVSDYNGMIIHNDVNAVLPPDYFNQIMDQVADFIPGLDAIYLTRNPAGNFNRELCKFSASENWNGEHSSHLLELDSDWKTLYAKIRSRKSRQRLRSKLRALRSEHTVTFRRIKNPDEAMKATQQILSWKSDQLSDRGSRDPFGTELNPGTVRQAITSCVVERSGHAIKVFGLFRDGELVAGMLAFVQNGTFYYLVSAYAPHVPAKFSVGTQMLVKSIELASRAGLRQYDFLLGDEAYKYDWCDTHIPLMNHLIPITFKGKIYGHGVKLLFAIKKRILASPFLTGIIRKLIKAQNLESRALKEPVKAPGSGKTTYDAIYQQKHACSLLLTDPYMPNGRI